MIGKMVKRSSVSVASFNKKHCEPEKSNILVSQFELDITAVIKRCSKNRDVTEEHLKQFKAHLQIN